MLGGGQQAHGVGQHFRDGVQHEVAADEEMDTGEAGVGMGAGQEPMEQNVEGSGMEVDGGAADAAGGAAAQPQQHQPQQPVMDAGSLYRFIGLTPTGWQLGRLGANGGGQLGLGPAESVGMTLRDIKKSAIARLPFARHTLHCAVDMASPTPPVSCWSALHGI